MAYLAGELLIETLPRLREFRTEKLTIVLNAKYPALITYTKILFTKLFEKEPTVHQVGNGVQLWVYQKQISRRLGIPSGSRSKSVIRIPSWIWESQEFLLAYLKGLFEAEGSLSIHFPTSTYNFQFSNRNPSLLKNVGRILERLGFHPEYRPSSTRLRRRLEVENFKNLIAFRLHY